MWWKVLMWLKLDNSPAQKAQIEVEDIIIEFDGKKVKGDDDQGLAKMILNKKVGDKVRLKIWREGKILEKELTLSSYKE